MEIKSIIESTYMIYTASPDLFTCIYLVGDTSLFRKCLYLHWAAFFSFLHLITKFNWLHGGDRLRWLTREQELKWQQLMRLAGTQRVRHCCCSNNNFSEQHADSSRDTDRVLTALLAALFTFVHTAKYRMHTQHKLTTQSLGYTKTHCRTQVDRCQSGDVAVKKILGDLTVFFMPLVKLHVSQSHPSLSPWTKRREVLVLTDAQTAWGRRGTRNDSGRCVRLMGFNLLRRRLTQVLTLLRLPLTKTNTNAIKMWSTFHFFAFLGVSTTLLLWVTVIWERTPFNVCVYKWQTGHSHKVNHTKCWLSNKLLKKIKSFSF